MDKEKNTPFLPKADHSVPEALRDGGFTTRLSAFIMGAGNILHGQIVKGLLYLFAETAFWIFMFMKGFHNIARLPGLGSVPRREVWNEKLQIYEYIQGDQSIQILLYGIATLMLAAIMFLVWMSAVKSAYQVELLARNGLRVPTIRKDLGNLLQEHLHWLLMSPSVFFILVLTVLPLIFMISMAFTNYSRIDNHLILFDWTGLQNFKTLFDKNSVLGSTFWHVLLWTLVWAFFATFTNYFFGMLLALLINRKDTKGKQFWRFCFILSSAVPMFVSLLVIRTMLQPEGAVNILLRDMKLIPPGVNLPFLTDTTWARITVIVVNIWVGVPYTLVQLTGVLENIPADLYEAAELDGAGAIQKFFSITLPYMLYVTTPYLIATFTANVNNFNVIYLLSKGGPVTNLASTAGDTDLLVTWLYNLTIEKQYYNIGAVVGILTFVILAVGSLVTYHRSKSYKEDFA